MDKVDRPIAIILLISCGLIFSAGVGVGLIYPHINKESTNSLPKLLKVDHIFIKDEVTKCQYIVSNGAMYPRLDDKRRHICSDENKYQFSTPTEG